MSDPTVSSRLDAASLLVKYAEAVVAKQSTISGADLLNLLRQRFSEVAEMVEQIEHPAPVGKCRHCGYDVVERIDGVLAHALPDGGIGDRGCRANLFHFDEDRWIEMRDAWRGLTATLERQRR